MDEAGDFDGGEGIGEVVEVVDPGGVLEAETVLTPQGSLKSEALAVGAGEGTTSAAPVGVQNRALNRCVVLWAGDEFGRRRSTMTLQLLDASVANPIPRFTKPVLLETNCFMQPATTG
jgi:hypothetical protein